MKTQNRNWKLDFENIIQNFCNRTRNEFEKIHKRAK